MNTELLVKTIFAVLSAMVGGVITFSIKVDHHKLCKLIAFSAGALSSTALFTIIPEAKHSLDIIEIIIFTSIGILFFTGISKFVAHLCPACSATHFDEKTTHHLLETVMAMMSVFVLHSFLDGIAISVGEMHDGFHHTIFAAVLTHKFPEGLALASLMLSSGYKKKKILIYLILIESMTIVGGLAGEHLFSNILTERTIAIIQASIAGGFIFLSAHAIIGEVFTNHKKLVTLSFLSGVLLILLMRFLLS